MTILEQEMREQGAVLAARTAAGRTSAAAAAALLGRADVRHLVIAARGTSDSAARYAQYLLGSEVRLLAGLATPYLYRDAERAPRLDGAAVVGISQSGRSPDIVGVLAAARAQGRPTLAITNETASPLAAEADVVIALEAGAERSVAATKTYLATLHAIVQILEALAPDAGRAAWLDRLPELVSSVAASALADRARTAAVLGPMRAITAVGRGLWFATACESALKIRELSGTPVEAFSPPDLMHGPIAAIGAATGVWICGPADGVGGQLIERSGASVAVGATAADDAAADVAIDLAVAPAGAGAGATAPDWVRAILAVVPAQAAGLALAELRGSDVDHPHGLSKVTLTH